MTLDELIKHKLERLESVPDNLVSATEAAQKAILKEAIKSLQGIDTDGSGNIIFSKANLAQIETILNKLNTALFGSEYTDAITTFAKEMAKQANFTNSYFKLQFDYAAPDVLAELLKNSQHQALKLLDQDAVSSALMEPLRAKLSASITTGASTVDMISTLNDFIVGSPDKEGLLLRHVKRVSYDAFAVSDAQYTNAFATEVGAKWFLYQGGVVADSRQWCIDHHGGYYTKEEIESWAFKDWQGKNPDTNSSTIFVFRGGYHCLHGFLPFAEAAVPKKWVERAKQLGYY
jgi:hypothetical protein